MISNENQYEFEIREDGKRIAGHKIDDPFITSVVGFHLNRRDAFKAIFRPLVKSWRFRVWGTDEAYRVVFRGDYTPPEPGPAVYMEAGVNQAAPAETEEITDQESPDTVYDLNSKRRIN